MLPFRVEFAEIMTILWKRLNDHGKNWRHVYKVCNYSRQIQYLGKWLRFRKYLIVGRIQIYYDTTINANMRNEISQLTKRSPVSR